MKQIFSFLLGGLFALGLMISGMANPEKVLSFLDLFGAWDPSLAFVMGGAILVAFLPFQKAVRTDHAKTIFDTAIQLPSKTELDHKLILGAFIFGAGWGIAGICPAPALTLIGLGHYEGLYFIVSMLLAMLIYEKVFGVKSS